MGIVNMIYQDMKHHKFFPWGRLHFSLMLYVELKVIVEQLFLWEDLVLLNDLLKEKCQENPTLHKNSTVGPKSVCFEKSLLSVIWTTTLAIFFLAGVVATIPEAPQIQELHRW